MEPTVPVGFDEDAPNFMEWYADNHEKLDALIIHKHGEKSIDLELVGDPEDFYTIPNSWRMVADAVFFEHFYDWFSVFAGMNTYFNPLWNVDGTETMEYGSTLQTTTQGEQNNQATAGTRKSTTKGKGKAFDSATLVQTSEAETTTDSVIDSSKIGQRVDTVAGAIHTDKVTRQGNIGVTKSTELLEDANKLRANYNFLNIMTDAYISELGAFYE